MKDAFTLVENHSNPRSKMFHNSHLGLAM